MSAADVIENRSNYSIDHGDCLELMQRLPEKSVDLTLFSPPYEQARLYLENGYDLGISRDTEEWVAWMVEVFRACLRVTRGLVTCVCEGQTSNYRYSCGPFLLVADLCRAGVTLRKPPIYHRVGIPGSGGPDWLRNDTELVICATNGGKLPWSDNTAMGHAPKFDKGGPVSYRTLDGDRVNSRPKINKCSRRHSKGKRDDRVNVSPMPDIANPGNVISVKVGGGVMGSELCHENEAPFPEALAEFFVRSFCPPDGIILDPFSGSATTVSVAVEFGRRAIGMDLRQSQVDLGLRRLSTVTPKSLFQIDEVPGSITDALEDTP